MWCQISIALRLFFCNRLLRLLNIYKTSIFQYNIRNILTCLIWKARKPIIENRRIYRLTFHPLMTLPLSTLHLSFYLVLDNAFCTRVSICLVFLVTSFFYLCVQIFETFSIEKSIDLVWAAYIIWGNTRLIQRSFSIFFYFSKHVYSSIILL